MDNFDTIFSEAVKNNYNISGVLRSLHKARVGSNYRYVRKHIKRLSLDISHWTGYPVYHKTKTNKIKDMFKRNSQASTSNIKKFIIKHNLIKYKCSKCSLKNMWKGKKLVLRLDHINGIRNDNRLKNLRFLCPNCDSQTSTFCGRNRKFTSKNQPSFISNKMVNIPKYVRFKIKWPTITWLRKELLKKSFVQLGKELGVSDHAIKKRLLNHGKTKKAPKSKFSYTKET